MNLLKEWVERPDRKAEVLLIRRVPEDEEVVERYLHAAASLDLDLSHLPEEKQLQVRTLCNSEIFQENPGKTNLVKHDIVLKERASVRRLTYRIPERLLTMLNKEVNLILSLGIIEPSKSEWCNLVILDLFEHLEKANYLTNIDLCKSSNSMLQRADSLPDTMGFHSPVLRTAQCSSNVPEADGSSTIRSVRLCCSIS